MNKCEEESVESLYKYIILNISAFGSYINFKMYLNINISNLSSIFCKYIDI